MDKTLIDIRYYASEAPNESGRSLPSDCSRYFEFPKLLHYWGRRIALKAGGEGLSLGSFDHLYLNFTEALPVGVLKFSERTPEKWLRYIDVGVKFDDLKQLDEKEIEGFVIQNTFNSLEFLCEGDETKCSLIKAVAKDVDEFGTQIELPVKVKETKSYSVVITYKLRPNESKSYGIARYSNHKTGESFSTNFVDLKGPSDIFHLVGSVSVKDGIIHIKPRPSFKAGLYTNSYKVPIEIDIQEHTNA